jgi:hypothetical protein
MTHCLGAGSFSALSPHSLLETEERLTTTAISPKKRAMVLVDEGLFTRQLLLKCSYHNLLGERIMESLLQLRGKVSHRLFSFKLV